jgi:hypothetical protein
MSKHHRRTLPSQRIRNLHNSRRAPFPHTFGILRCVDCLETRPGSPAGFAFTVYRGNALCQGHYGARTGQWKMESR